MSRSRRKFPTKPWGNAGTMKAWRSSYNRRLRHCEKMRLAKQVDWDDYVPKIVREIADVWSSPKDGSTWGYHRKPKEEEAYNPRTGEYDWDWNTEGYWKKIFRK